MMQIRVGLGYDIHPFEEGRKLILGGVPIDYFKGLKGHSDADCLSHAIADALLGAMGLSDIGHYFPDTDARYKDMNSQGILVKCKEELNRLGWVIANIDAMIIAQEPKIAPYIDSMKVVMAKSLEIEPTRLGIKATTNERIGDIGRGAGIAVHAVALINKG